MTSTTVTIVINYLTELFALEGTPLDILTDNRQPFKTKEWYTFTDKYALKHTISSPHYPQSNTFIDMHVCAIANAPSKANVSTVPVLQALMKLQETPVGQNLISPTKIIHN